MRYVMCIDNTNYSASLEIRKVYDAIEDTQAASHSMVRVIDESGEDYLYPDKFCNHIPASCRKTSSPITVDTASDANTDASRGKQVKEYLVFIEKGTSNWGATVPELPGIGTVGETKEQVVANVREAIEDYLAPIKELRLPIPSDLTVERVAVAA